VAEYGLHSLRHSLNTWLNARGVPEMTRMRLAGHSNADVNRGYTHEEHEQLSEALQKIPDVFEPEKA
jgi:integrase